MHDELINKKEKQPLRPLTFEDFPGQTEVKERLQLFVSACKKRKESLDHCLLSGPPGLGKTTLAQIIAQSLGASFRATTGPAIRRKGDLAALLTTLQKGTVLFIDEIHRLVKDVEEYLYSAMEDFYIDVITGEGLGAKSIRFQLPHFTLVGATTRVGLLKAPFRDRFGVIERLTYYDIASLQKIIQRSAQFLNLKLSTDGAEEIAKRSRGTPRVANRLLKRIRDYAQVKNIRQLNQESVSKGLSHLGVTHEGLTFMDEAILLLVAREFKGGPVGIDSIASSLSEDTSTMEDVYEPFLVQQGFLQRSPKGRMLTPKGREYVQNKKSFLISSETGR